jgi:hypothetical protein
MDWNILARKLSAAGFRAIGTALGGPAGAAVGETIASRLSVEPTPDSIARALVNNPDAEIALRQIDQEMFAATIAANEKARQDYETAIASARTATSGHWLTPVMSLIFIGIVFAFGAALFLVPLPEQNRDMINLLLGAVIGWVGAATTYWLGSSRGSAEKQEILDKAMTR